LSLSKLGWNLGAERRVITGVDEPDHSHHALRWAMQESLMHHTLLTAIAAAP
jgi:hypothetical protein